MKKDLSLKAAKAILRMEDSNDVELKILKEITPFGELTMFDGVDGFMGGHPFMIGKRVAELLDINNSSRAVSNLSKSITLGEYFDEYSVVSQYDTTDKAHKTMVSSLQKQFTNSWRSVKLIQIGGLFELIGKSRKPKAIEFGEFVNYEILPKIARTGEYSINDEKLREENLKLKAMLKSKDAEIDRVRQAIEPDTLAKVIEGNGQHIYRVRRSTMAIHTLEEFSKKVREKRDEDLAKQNSLYQSFMNEKNAKYTNLINGVRQNANRDLEIIQRVINSISTNSNDPFICNELHNYKQNCIKRANEIKRMKNDEIAKLSNSLAQLQNYTLERHQTRIHTINEDYAIGMEHTEEEYNRLAREKYEIALRVRESNDTNGLEAQLLLQLLAD